MQKFTLAFNYKSFYSKRKAIYFHDCRRLNTKKISNNDFTEKIILSRNEIIKEKALEVNFYLHQNIGHLGQQLVEKNLSQQERLQASKTF